MVFLSFKVVNCCVWVFKGCEECCYDCLRYIVSIRDELFDEVVGGVEVVYKVVSIKMLYQKKFEGYLLKEVD